MWNWPHQRMQLLQADSVSELRLLSSECALWTVFLGAALSQVLLLCISHCRALAMDDALRLTVSQPLHFSFWFDKVRCAWHLSRQQAQLSQAASVSGCSGHYAFVGFIKVHCAWPWPFQQMQLLTAASVSELRMLSSECSLRSAASVPSCSGT